tara:strand:- start:33 stop:968 length:936 start_codon:yes stop_codon:yes gene_type:complete
MLYEKINFKHIAPILLVMFLWAICFPLITLGIKDAPHLTFAALRAALAGVSLLILASMLSKPMPKGLRMWSMLTLVGLGATTLGFFGMFHAAEFIAPGIATVIANIQPLLAAVLAYFILNEPLSNKGKLGLFLGFIGIILIVFPNLSAPGSSGYFMGFVYVIFAVLGVTISNIIIKHIAGSIDAITAMGWQLVLGSLPLAFLAFATENPLSITWSGNFILSLIGLSIPGTAFVYWLWFTILEKTDLNRANSFAFLVPVFGLAMGMVFYGERLDGIVFLGVAVILTGILLVNTQQVPEPIQRKSVLQKRILL